MIEVVLLSFSIPDHIPKIKDGSKHQTTRIPREPRINGKPPYSVGDKVQLYYRSRMQESCKNCLVMNEPQCFYISVKQWPECDVCCAYTNFFGESTITEILHYWDAPYKENGTEVWMGSTIGHLDDEDREAWAIADGFKNWGAAEDYFVGAKKDGYDNFWYNRNYDVIIWDSEPIIWRW